MLWYFEDVFRVLFSYHLQHFFASARMRKTNWPCVCVAFFLPIGQEAYHLCHVRKLGSMPGGRVLCSVRNDAVRCNSFALCGLWAKIFPHLWYHMGWSWMIILIGHSWTKVMAENLKPPKFPLGRWWTPQHPKANLCHEAVSLKVRRRPENLRGEFPPNMGVVGQSDG